MTSETRILIEVSDVSGIELECPDCRARVFYPVEKNHDRIARQCPNCNREWFTFSDDPRNRGSVSMEQIKMLLRVVGFLGKPTDMHAHLRLHVNTSNG